MAMKKEHRALLKIAAVAVLVWTVMEVTPLGEKMREIGSDIFSKIKREGDEAETSVSSAAGL